MHYDSLRKAPALKILNLNIRIQCYCVVMIYGKVKKSGKVYTSSSYSSSADRQLRGASGHTLYCYKTTFSNGRLWRREQNFNLLSSSWTDLNNKLHSLIDKQISNGTRQTDIKELLATTAGCDMTPWRFCLDQKVERAAKATAYSQLTQTLCKELCQETIRATTNNIKMEMRQLL